MDWQGLAKGVGAFGLEFLGNTILGPTGAQLGGKLAEAIGLKDGATATQEEVEQALRDAPPEVIVEIKKLDADLKKRQLEHVETMQGLISGETTQTLESVNQTMRKEAEQGHPWAGAWRPFWGFVSAGAFGVAILGLFILAAIGVAKGNEALLKHIPDFTAQLAILFGIPGAILGVASWHRGQMQRIQAGETKPSILGTVQTIFKGGNSG